MRIVNRTAHADWTFVSTHLVTDSSFAVTALVDLKPDLLKYKYDRTLPAAPRKEADPLPL